MNKKSLEIVHARFLPQDRKEMEEQMKKMDIKNMSRFLVYLWDYFKRYELGK